MKTKKLFTAVLISTLAFTACSNDEEINNSQEEIRIVTSIDGQIKTKASFNPDGSGTFESGDTITLSFMNTNRGFGGSGDYKIGTTSWYWDDVYYNDTSIDFVAWYPAFSFSGSLIYSYSVASATTEADKDFLITPKVSALKGNTVNLQFKHVMHKLAVNFSSNVYNAAQMNNATISLKNLKSDAQVNFMEGVVNESGASGTEAYASKHGSTVEFIVAPQTLTSGTEILNIEVAGRTFTWSVPATLTKLESGKIQTLNLSVNRDNIVLNTSSIAAWNNQASITDSFVY